MNLYGGGREGGSLITDSFGFHVVPLITFTQLYEQYVSLAILNFISI